jgi:hypothetical protein
MLIAFSLYRLLRPKLPAFASDGGIGVLNGALGGATGLAGIIGTIWCGMRDWSSPEQRAVFQPVGVSVFLMTDQCAIANRRCAGFGHERSDDRCGCAP